jgi:hypothetical protein
MWTMELLKRMRTQHTVPLADLRDQERKPAAEKSDSRVAVVNYPGWKPP